MRRISRWVRWLAVAVLWPVPLLLALVLLFACPETPFPGSELADPSGRYVAAFHGHGYGGAAGGISLYVTVRRATDDLDDAEYALLLEQAHEVCLRWTGERALRVEYPDDARDVVTKDRVELDVPIAIELVPAPARDGKLVGACAGTLAELQDVGEDWARTRQAE